MLSFVETALMLGMYHPLFLHLCVCSITNNICHSRVVTVCSVKIC